MSQWKTGKTTLLSVLLARMVKGGTLAGLPVSPGKAAIISEEGPEIWHKRCQKLRIAEDAISLYCRPFKSRPTSVQWRELIETTLELRRDEGLDLVAIDPLAAFLPTGNENSAGAVMDCLLPLQELTAAGLSVLLLLHPRKGPTAAGQAARGSGALPSHADILLEMKWFGNPQEEDRRRWLRAFSREEETRRTLLVELTPAGDDYLVHDSGGDEILAESYKVIYFVLEDAKNRLTQRQILKQWPRDFPTPDQSTVARGLARGLAEGRIHRQGTGRRNDPYRYYLPDKEDWLYPIGASREEADSWTQRFTARFLKGSPTDHPLTAVEVAPKLHQPPNGDRDETTASIHDDLTNGDQEKTTSHAHRVETPLSPGTPGETGRGEGAGTARADGVTPETQGAGTATRCKPDAPIPLAIEKKPEEAASSPEPTAPAVSATPVGLLATLANDNGTTDWRKARRLPP